MLRGKHQLIWRHVCSLLEKRPLHFMTKNLLEAVAKRNHFSQSVFYSKQTEDTLRMGNEMKLPQQKFNDRGLLELAKGKSEERRNDELNAIENLKNLSSEDQKKLEICKIELQIYTAEGGMVPTEITAAMWWHVVQHGTSKNMRKKIWKYYRRKEIFAEKQKEEKAAAAQFRERASENQDGLPKKRRFFQMIRESTMNKFYDNELYYKMVHGPHIIIDFDYGDFMTYLETNTVANQVKLAYSLNKMHQDPVHLHLCNLGEKSLMRCRLEDHFTTFNERAFTVNPEDYTKFYSKERLVYLSPHAREELKEYNEDDVYIIGGLADKAVQEPLSFTKAKKEGIRSYKFPLDRYLSWAQGNKCLTVNCVMAILLDLRHTGDWKKALEHIPKRMIRSGEDQLGDMSVYKMVKRKTRKY